MTFKRITCDPKRMNGQPCVRQLRLTVRRVVEAVATYPKRKDLQREFPELEEEDIREALAYAAANLDDKVIELSMPKSTDYAEREYGVTATELARFEKRVEKHIAGQRKRGKLKRFSGEIEKDLAD